jgi:putative peptidoglycan binding protein
MKEKPKVIRSPEPRVGGPREAEERRRVAEIARDIEELGRSLEGRDRLAGFARAERAKRSLVQAERPSGGVGDHSTLESDPLPAVADMFSATKKGSSRGGKFATIPAKRQQRKHVAEDSPATKGRIWRASFAAVIIMLSLVSGGALMLMSSPAEIAQDAYRRAVAGMHLLTAREDTATEPAGARNAAEEKAVAKEVERIAAEEKLEAVVEEHQNKTRQDAEEKGKAKAAPETTEIQARAAGREAAKPQSAGDAHLNAEETARKVIEATPKSDSPVRQHAGIAQADLNPTEQDRNKAQRSLAARHARETELDARQQAERAESGLQLSEKDRKRVQVALNSLGHEIPTATGFFGPRTRAMITAWQKAQGLPETGYLTKTQLATLQQQAAAALAKYDQSQRRVKEDPRITK